MNYPSQKQVLLAVLAHPDDETFGMGGTLALYASRGVEVHLVCATRGEVGEMDPKLLEGFSSIAERRELELCCAADMLGLKAVHFLDYRDSGMPGSPDNTHPSALAAQPVEQVAEQVAHWIRKLKPQVVLTFDPVGGYYHPDHIAIHKATVAGVELAKQSENGDPGMEGYAVQKLYYHTMPKGFIRTTVRLMKLVGKDPTKFGTNKDVDLEAIARVSFPIHAIIRYASAEKLRAKASACHESQGGKRMGGGPLGFLLRLFSAKDTFMRAYPPVQTRQMEKDLFEGVQ
ncbi:MAG: PIG-L family deacetylase [Anaerolineaceae bacterium]|nr:PIG-L family deacetylase [Anaerolineaceae bacterium]